MNLICWSIWDRVAFLFPLDILRLVAFRTSNNCLEPFYKNINNASIWKLRGCASTSYFKFLMGSSRKLDVDNGSRERTCLVRAEKNGNVKKKMKHSALLGHCNGLTPGYCSTPTFTFYCNNSYNTYTNISLCICKSNAWPSIYLYPAHFDFTDFETLNPDIS